MFVKFSSKASLSVISRERGRRLHSTESVWWRCLTHQKRVASCLVYFISQTYLIIWAHLVRCASFLSEIRRLLLPALDRTIKGVRYKKFILPLIIQRTFAFLPSSVSICARFRFFLPLPDVLSPLCALFTPAEISWLKKGSDKSTSDGISSLSSESLPDKLQQKTTTII